MEINADVIKTGLRFVIVAVTSWFVTQLLAQITVIPETRNVHVWEFVFAVPVRLLVQSFLTFLLAALDRMKFVRDRDLESMGVPATWRGVVPF